MLAEEEGDAELVEYGEAEAKPASNKDTDAIVNCILRK